MTPTHIFACTRHPAAAAETSADHWVVGTEDEMRQHYEESLKNPDLYCAAVSRIEISTDWGGANLLEAAAVAWETVLGLDPAPECIESEGTAATRLAVVALASTLSEAYHLSPEATRGACFDWDFAPRFFRDCVEWSQGGPILRPDWKERAATEAPAPARAQSRQFQLPHYDITTPSAFDALEIHTVIDSPDCCEAIPAGDEIPEGASIIFSLYGHTPGAGLECLGDFASFDAACDVAARLGGV
jgi:hypothetical protein